MHEFHGRATTRVSMSPRAVFDLIIDVDRLPEWNRAIESVIDRPPALAEGTEWTVKMHPPHTPAWRSVSRVEQLDRQHLRFAYETRNADGNPSYTTWTWQVAGNGDGAEITAAWDCYLKTADRKFFAGPVRKRQLAREVPKSLTNLARTLGAAPATP
jgi:uncharacterized protein YndB with AHSA1/START domain